MITFRDEMKIKTNFLGYPHLLVDKWVEDFIDKGVYYANFSCGIGTNTDLTCAVTSFKYFRVICAALASLEV